MKSKFKTSYFLFFVILLSCGRKGEDSFYLIPKDFEGNLLIAFSQEKGTDTVYETQVRLYVFDTTGVLMTKFLPNYGIQQNRYYYVDSLGNRTEIKYALPSQLNETENVVIINPETGNYFDTSKKVQRHFETLIVAKQKNADSIANLSSNFMWKVLK